jgi:hypothetical protein
MRILAETRRRAETFARTQPFYWREAALCVPAIPITLLVGLFTHNIAYGAVAAGAAFTVGFGAARDLRGRRWAAMIAATIGVTIMAFIGVVAGQWEPALLIVSAIAAATCAVLALIDEDIWWISLQMVIALLVGGYFSGDVHAAELRSLAVLSGGTTQLVVVVILAKLAPAAANRLPPGPKKGPAPRALMISHGLRAAACVVLSLVLARLVGLANSYWAPMTAMLILKPGLSETHTRGIARLTGTVLGCIAASLFAILIGYSQPWLVGGVALTAGAAFALQKAHYSVLTSAVTATVVLLLSIAHGGGVLANAEHRLMATLLGGCVALLLARIAPHRPITIQAQTGQTPDQVGEGNPAGSST